MGQRILVVDDEPDVVKTVGYRLTKAGFDVTVAVDGQEALDKMEAKIPDLVLLDLRLPLLDGYEVCRRIKSHASWKTVPVILFTASAQASSEEILLSVGAEDCVTKPFEWDVLFKKIQKCLTA